MSDDLETEYGTDPTFILITDQSDMEYKISVCQTLDHIQQVAYSTYHKALTQICFTCQHIRTSLEGTDIK